MEGRNDVHFNYGVGEGGEGGEEGGSPESPGSKVAGDDASSAPASPGSAADGAASLTPVGTAPTSPASPLPMPGDTQDAESGPDPLVNRDAPSSRSPSRDSRGSSVPPRCPSRESLCSERGGGNNMTSSLPASSPVAVLPQHSVAIAAYLGAGQHPHHRLLMTSPLPPVLPRGSVSPLVSSSSSPPILAGANTVISPPPPPLGSPMETDSTVLDFSTKRSHVKTPREEPEGESVLNLSKPPTPVLSTEIQQLNSPLDLSVSSRKRSLDESSSQSHPSLSPSPHQPTRKNSRLSAEFKSVVSPWTSPVVASHFQYFAAAVANASSLSPKNTSNNTTHGSAESQLWNGKIKLNEKQTSPFVPTPSDASKALEKMKELSKLGGDDLFRPSVNAGVGGTSAGVGSTSGSRHSAWQSHWLNKGAEQAKDVLKCVWCKQSFPSLAAMTAHMKEAKHCGVNVPAPQIQPPPPPPPHQPPTSTPSTPTNSNTAAPTSLSGNNKPPASDLNLLIKETMPLPRKLVRGQDVWLGKGAEQTRQILKCMWCGQSFRSLAEMTSHMQQTQHYTNIISQEQIISWKSSDENKSAGGGGGGTAAGGAGGTSSHVSAVLTCKVCDQAFSSLKELSNHMVKNSHYKEHIMRSITESGGRRRQTREKRKKSLPVRKLLELERAQHDLKNGEGGVIVGSGGKLGREPSATGRITCEKCGEKIETSIFVDHIRQCVGGGSIGNNQRNLLKSALLSSNVLPPENPVIIGHMSDRDGRKSIGEDPTPPPGRHHRSPSLATDLSAPAKEGNTGPPAGGDSSSPSVLNAIEKLIEKSFDSRARHGAAGAFGGGPVGSAPMGSSILKRLGIDESVDYTKPLVDAQTMNILRSYHHHHHNQQHHFSRRERSGSESSSVSDRGGGRTEVLTPDRRLEPVERLLPSTPRTTPEKRIQTPPSAKVSVHEETVDEDMVKKEVISEDDRDEIRKSTHADMVVKKEEVDDVDDEDEDRASYHSGSAVRQRRADDVSLTPVSGGGDEDGDEVIEAGGRRSASSAGVPSPVLSPRQQTPLTPSAVDNVAGVPNSPCRNSTSSPASSERSGTPRSSVGAEKKSSLGALSSMFDSLSGGGGGNNDGASSSGRSSSSHPLAALQKLCDKTERHGGSGGRAGVPSNTGGSGNHTSATGTAATQGSVSGTAPGAILAFSWACNDAVMTSDSIMKCAFCDTPFISKGAYRHHLSKMHFVKDGVIPDPVALKAQQQQSSSSSAGAPQPGKGGIPTANSSGASNSSGAPGTSGKSPQHGSNFEESPHSKFLKYTELAKQLSSKYV